MALVSRASITTFGMIIGERWNSETLLSMEEHHTLPEGREGRSDFLLYS
jgi:hypothetical protein